VTLAIGVDVGGTKVLGGVVDDDGKVIAEIRRPTPSQDPDETAEVIVGVILELCADHEAVAVGVGAAGFIDESRSTVRFAPNLAWRDEPLRERLAGRVPLPVFIENDANAAGWAESRFGAGPRPRRPGADHRSGPASAERSCWTARSTAAGSAARRARAHDRRARRHPLRLRQPGVLGAVQQRAAR
jgi:hypothetical protein